MNFGVYMKGVTAFFLFFTSDSCEDFLQAKLININFLINKINQA